jgi:phosphate transport system substrate-binding protein
MRYRNVLRSYVAILAVSLLTTAVGLAAPPSADAAPSHARISGTGSTWSSNAVLQWNSDVSQSGLQVDFTGNGSAQGRKDFTNRITDFAVSDIGYQGDSSKSLDDTNCLGGTKGCRDFVYEPIVAGGTSFPYQVKVGGKLVSNLRLSGDTLAKIFTYKITNWNDPQITGDNNGRKLPSLKIIPVVHSEGSGSTAQLTTYFDTQYPSIWRAFLGHPGFTEFFPPPTNGKGIAQNGSDGVMNFVASKGANGAIGYDEYSYPLQKNFPVAKVLNNAGYYTLPDQFNVAVALQHAIINNDKNSKNYLLQKLNQVYVAPEVQAYPLSSYSYILIPTSPTDQRMTLAKRQTLVDYLGFAICEGQAEIGPIGYSSLPINLVQASFDQTNKLKVADPKVVITKKDPTKCDNPTYDPAHPKVNLLAEKAPKPPACDKKGAGPCNADGSAPGGGFNGGTGGSGGPGAGGGSSDSRGSSANGNSSTGKVGNGSAATKTAGTTIDPNTGLVQSNASQGGAGGDAQANPAELAGYQRPGLSGVLGPLAVIELIALLVLPPVVYFYGLRRRKKS